MPQVTAGVALVVWLTCVLCGRAQRRQAGAGWARLVGVSLVLALLVVSPLLLGLICGTNTWVFAAILRREGSVDGPLPLDLLVVVVATILSLKVALSALRPVGRFFARGEDLPPLEDRAVLERIAELARGMGVGVPRVLLRGSSGPQLQALAAAGGIVGRALVVSDGVLHKLSPSERDAILAHELAHIAKRTIWKYVALMIASQVVASLSSAFTAPLVALVLCLTLLWVVIKVAGHFEEPGCDLLAARAVGFATTASALDKIHAGHAIDQEGPMAAWIHATQTHPSRAVRLGVLHAAAPDAEKASIEYDPETVRADTRVSRAVLATALAVVAGAVWAGAQPGGRWYGVAMLLVVILVPPFLLLAPHLRDVVSMYRLRIFRVPVHQVLRLFAFLVALGLVYAGTALASSGVASSWTVPGAIALLVLAVVLPRRGARVASKVQVALGAHDFDTALKLLAGLPPRVARRPENRYYTALARALRGDREAAIADLEALLQDSPRYHPARMLMGTLVAGDDPARTLALAEAIEAAVPGTHQIAVFRAAALRRLGRCAEARELVDRALQRKPRDGAYLTLSARIAMSAGELDRAAELLARAQQRAPGEAFGILVEAELAVALGESEAARSAVERAREASDRQPQALLERDVAALEQRLTTIAT